MSSQPVWHRQSLHDKKIFLQPWPFGFIFPVHLDGGSNNQVRAAVSSLPVITISHRLWWQLGSNQSLPRTAAPIRCWAWPGRRQPVGTAARPPSAAAPSFPPTPWPPSLHKLRWGDVAKNTRSHKPQQGSPGVYSFPFWAHSHALKGGVCTDSGICNLVLTLLYSAADRTLENFIQNDGLPCCFVNHLPGSNFLNFYSMLLTTLQKIQIVFNSSQPFPWRSKFSILFGIKDRKSVV